MKEIYNYQARVDRIIDGDTIVVDLDLGFATWRFNQHIRLYGINAPEMKTGVLGEQSKKWLQDALKLDSMCIIHSHGFDVFGRILGTIYTDTDKSINETMIEKKLAVPFRA